MIVTRMNPAKVSGFARMMRKKARNDRPTREATLVDRVGSMAEDGAETVAVSSHLQSTRGSRTP